MSHVAERPEVTASSSKRPTRPAIAMAVMGLAVLMVYVPIRSTPGDNALVGIDYLTLHLYRIRFAQDALFGPHPHLPAWYPRELLGTPFWSNIQSFPFLPTRLLLLMVVRDPLLLYSVAVNLAALLAAIFTFLYARKIGLSALSAAVAGWTFACSGFFAARVLAGHLPLLEAYPALPLLLWLVEICRDRSSRGANFSASLFVLGLACCCVALAGHPQLPIYAIAAAFVYAMYRCRAPAKWSVLAAIALGCGSAAFALWPMWLLIRRSARMLPLQASADAGLPYSRLVGFLFPWGLPRAISSTPPPLQNGGFWETVCYVGWMPVLVAMVLLIRAIRRRKPPTGPWAFIVAVGLVALFLALPVARISFVHVSGTLLRSPSRLLYVTVFSLAMGLGAGIELLLAGARAHQRPVAFVLLLFVGLMHGMDLGLVDRQFIRMEAFRDLPGKEDRQLMLDAGDSRVAIDFNLWTPLNRRIDDVGYFDSIALASSYRAMLDLGQKPSNLNSESIYGSDLSDRALAACGVKFTETTRPLVHAVRGAPLVAADGAPVLKYIANPASRAAFFPATSVITVPQAQIAQNLRDPNFDLSRWLMLDEGPDIAQAQASALPPPQPARLNYQRKAQDPEDDVTINVSSDQPGYLRWLEAADNGWQARLDGMPVRILPADNVFVSVFVPAGAHSVHLTYSTPGVAVGCVLSLVSVLFLSIVAFWPHQNRSASMR
jgi:hypothetical protein